MTLCPQCGYDLTTKRKVKRVCAACHQPILRHDKWEFNPDGRIQHRTCEHPQFYSAEQAQKAREPKPAPLFDRQTEGGYDVRDVCTV